MCCVSGSPAEKRFTVSVCVHALAGGHALTGRGLQIYCSLEIQVEFNSKLLA